MIIPGFGMISHVVSTFSGKPVFGSIGSPASTTALAATYCMRVQVLGRTVLICFLWTAYFSLVTQVFYPQGFFINIHLFSLGGLIIGPSTTLRTYSTEGNSLAFRKWVAGLIDGDGYFGLSRGLYGSIELTIEQRDISCLKALIAVYGGYIHPVNQKAARLRIHNAAGLIHLLTDLQGLVLNPVRFTQIQTLCTIYGLPCISPYPLYSDGYYLAGLIDSDGSIYANWVTRQLFITVSQKGRFMLYLLCTVYGGKVYPANAACTAYKWTVSRKADVLRLAALLENSCMSAKQHRLSRVPEFFSLSCSYLLRLTQQRYKLLRLLS